MLQRSLKTRAATISDFCSSVTALGDNVFRDCSSLASVQIPSSVTALGDGVFAGCSALASVQIPSAIKNLKTLGLPKTAKVERSP